MRLLEQRDDRVFFGEVDRQRQRLAPLALMPAATLSRSRVRRATSTDLSIRLIELFEEQAIYEQYHRLSVYIIDELAATRWRIAHHFTNSRCAAQRHR